MTIVPDDKDWTWVLEHQCPDCAFDARTVSVRDIGMITRDVASQWEVVLGLPGATVRPRPDVWSASEYGCHVRDVFRLFDERLVLMLELDDPAFANWDQDATAVSERYDQQDPLIVRRELVVAGDQVAERFDQVSGTQWNRTGRRSDGATFTVETFGKYFLHDPIHHLWDVSRSF